MVDYGLTITDSQGNTFTDKNLMTKLLFRKITNKNESYTITQNIGTAQIWASFMPINMSVMIDVPIVRREGINIVLSNPKNILGVFMVGVAGG